MKITPLKVDTLELNLFGSWQPRTKELLEKASTTLQRAKVEGLRKLPAASSAIELGGQKMELLGRDAHWSVIASCSTFKVYAQTKVESREHADCDKMPAAKIVIRSEWLASDRGWNGGCGGWRAQAEACIQRLRAGGLDLVRVRVGRIDLCVDQVSGEPRPEWALRCVTRNKVKPWLWEQFEPSNEATGEGATVRFQRLETLYVGKSAKDGVLMRLYDKLAEITAKDAKGAGWVREWWADVGFQWQNRKDGETVWRTEFQLGGDRLGEFNMREWEDLTDDAVLSLWQWCICAKEIRFDHRKKIVNPKGILGPRGEVTVKVKRYSHKGFCRIVRDRGGKKLRTRKLVPFWEKLADAALGAPKAQKVYCSADLVAERLWKQVLGVLGAHAAARGASLEFGEQRSRKNNEPHLEDVFELLRKDLGKVREAASRRGRYSRPPKVSGA